MKITILLFGQLTDIVGTSSITLDNITDTDMLVKNIEALYPAMLQAKYIIAVNQKTISTNTPLTDQCTVALLPPFSGG